MKKFVVYIESQDDSRYVWSVDDVEDGGYRDLPNGSDDLLGKAEAEQLKTDIEQYIRINGYCLSVGIEEVTNED